MSSHPCKICYFKLNWKLLLVYRFKFHNFTTTTAAADVMLIVVLPIIISVFGWWFLYRQWNGQYVTDFSTLLPQGTMYQPLPDTGQVEVDVSLVTGAMRTIGVTEDSADNKQVAVRNTCTTIAKAGSAKTAGVYLP